MQEGDLRGAATVTRQALDADPGETLLHNLAATLLLATGDYAGAQAEWEVAVRDMPGDGLAIYGMGLTYMARGDRARAAEMLRAAERNADPAYALLAGRYLEQVNGAVGGGAGLTLPDSCAAGALALSGMAMRASDHRRALSDLTGALSTLPGDPYSEPAGLLMTYDPAQPLRAGGAPLPRGNGLTTAREASERAYTGSISLEPNEGASDAGFVVFKIDGAFSSIVNTPPYRLLWNTARMSNGMHRIEIIVYDRQGRETARAIRRIRTANVDAPVRETPDTLRAARVRAGLWPFLMLRPSRAAVAYAAAEAARALGESAQVERWLEVVAAVDPDYRDVRARLTGAGKGLGEAAFWRGARDGNAVALTFDDGPKPGITEQILNVLTGERVPATFFVIGRHVTAHPEIVRRIAESGMQIENHTYSHPNLTILPESMVERELIRTVAAVRAATGRAMRFYRPPGGNVNATVNRAAARWGLTPCMWSVDGERLENGTPDRLVEFVVRRATPGAIILLHNGRMTTVEALPRIIAGLRRRGFRFVTVEQLAREPVAPVRATASVGGGRSETLTSGRH